MIFPVVHPNRDYDVVLCTLTENPFKNFCDLYKYHLVYLYMVVIIADLLVFGTCKLEIKEKLLLAKSE